MTTVNPVLPATALLRTKKPDVYLRNMIYDPTWNDPSYNEYSGQRIVPFPGSIVQDADTTPLWVISVDPVTYIPTYEAIRLGSDNDNVVSVLNYGSSVLRLYVDYRGIPYPATPDPKCLFIGKSPRFYTLVRYPNTPQETIISQYFDQSGQLISQLVPLKAMTDANNSWYLQRGHISQLLDDNEEIGVRIYNEDGLQVYDALLHVKESAVINEDIIYTPTIVGMTVTANQQLTNGDFFLYEKQDFSSLGFNVNLVYDDGSTSQIPIDGLKCRLYGKDDFISSFAGLRQTVTVKYFRSEHEAISPSIADATGSTIARDVPVTVVPNSLGTTVKIMPQIRYNTTTARYVINYFMYFSDGRSAIDVSGSVTTTPTTINLGSTHFGVAQSFVVRVDMKNVDPTNYPTSAIYQQNMVITFFPPNQLVRWTIRDSETSLYIFGQDNSTSRRPSIRYDRVRGQAFIPSWIFGNKQAFINSFYTRATPPYDPSVEQVPQQPTHFLLRDILTGNMIITAPIPIDSYAEPFNILGDTTGAYIGGTVLVEFVNIISAQVRRTLFGVPVNVSAGTYTTTP